MYLWILHYTKSHSAIEDLGALHRSHNNSVLTGSCDAANGRYLTNRANGEASLRSARSADLFQGFELRWGQTVREWGFQVSETHLKARPCTLEHYAQSARPSAPNAVAPRFSNCPGRSPVVAWPSQTRSPATKTCAMPVEACLEFW